MDRQRNGTAVLEDASDDHLSSDRVRLAAVVIGGCIVVAAMFSTLCCSFFWLQKRIITKTVKAQQVSKIASSPQIRILPAIRSQDVISFVLPTNVSRFFNHPGGSQVGFSVYEELNSNGIVRTLWDFFRILRTYKKFSYFVDVLLVIISEFLLHLGENFGNFTYTLDLSFRKFSYIFEFFVHFRDIFEIF